MTKSKMVNFTKMHGLGNDFVLIKMLDNNRPLAIAASTIIELADRHMGIGFDQLLIITPSTSGDFDFYCTIYNADGSEAEQCGNGLRCVARELHEQNRCGNTVRIATKAGIFLLEIKDYAAITINMGVPEIKNPRYQLTDDISFSLISLGNPHAILKVNSVADHKALQKAQQIYAHPMFPEGINVGLVEVLDQHAIALRTLERGTGETYACGSNACAATCASLINGWLHQDVVTVNCKKGQLKVNWQGAGSPIKLTGPATFVYAGTILL